MDSHIILLGKGSKNELPPIVNRLWDKTLPNGKDCFLEYVIYDRAKKIPAWATI